MKKFKQVKIEDLNSENFPIKIDKILEEEDVFISLTFCPGKKGVSGSGVWNRDLTLDFEKLKEYKVEVIVPLITDYEFKKLKVEDYFKLVEEKEMKMIHFPIGDVTVPKDINTFKIFIDQLYDEYKNKKNILIHCRGGLGRAGLVGACLLIKIKNLKPKEAINIIRNKRSNKCIETIDQEKYVDKYYNLINQ